MATHYTVLGAGMMGSAVAYDLATFDPGCEVVLADVDLDAARRAAASIGPAVKPRQLDVNNRAALSAALDGSAAIVSAVSYAVNVDVTRAALEAGVHMCDLGGNNDVVRQQIALDAEARRRGVTVVPNCGLAPGLINVLAVTGAREFDRLDSVRLRVGGLPQHPRPPPNYQIAFSVEGLINEYVEPAEAIRDGSIVTVPSMEDLEEIRFPEPLGVLEAFNTSGGISTLTQHFAGKVRHLDYKTIRYRGHCEKFRTLLDLGFASPEPLMIGGALRTSRELFANLLRKKLDFGDTDVVLARAILTGTRGGRAQTLTYECIDYYDPRTRMTAMMRTTAFPTAVIALMLARDVITRRGVMPPELCAPGDAMIVELAKRGISITRNVTTA